MKLFVMMLVVFVCSFTSAFGNETNPVKLVKLNDAQLDNVSAGFFDININISPVVTIQTAINVTTQLAVFSSGYQEVFSNASNFAMTHFRINR
jgi:hypothetical protein